MTLALPKIKPLRLWPLDCSIPTDADLRRELLMEWPRIPGVQFYREQHDGETNYLWVDARRDLPKEYRGMRVAVTVAVNGCPESLCWSEIDRGYLHRLRRVTLKDIPNRWLLHSVLVPRAIYFSRYVHEVNPVFELPYPRKDPT